VGVELTAHLSLAGSQRTGPGWRFLGPVLFIDSSNPPCRRENPLGSPYTRVAAGPTAAPRTRTGHQGGRRWPARARVQGSPWWTTSWRVIAFASAPYRSMSAAACITRNWSLASGTSADQRESPQRCCAGAQGIPSLELPKHHPNMRLGACVPSAPKRESPAVAERGSLAGDSYAALPRCADRGPGARGAGGTIRTAARERITNLCKNHTKGRRRARTNR
jgi:hypothetical protein